jgi:hypothetical protein
VCTYVDAQDQEEGRAAGRGRRNGGGRPRRRRPGQAGGEAEAEEDRCHRCRATMEMAAGIDAGDDPCFSPSYHERLVY